MISQREQQLISDALQKAYLTELPEKADKKSVWLEAVAKIRLADGSVGYGILKRNQDLTHRVTYINGNIASIVEVEEVYPYITLQKEYIKKFTAKEKEPARIAYLKSLHLPYEIKGLEEMDIDQLNKEVVKAAMWQQMQDMSK